MMSPTKKPTTKKKPQEKTESEARKPIPAETPPEGVEGPESAIDGVPEKAKDPKAPVELPSPIKAPNGSTIEKVRGSEKPTIDDLSQANKWGKNDEVLVNTYLLARVYSVNPEDLRKSGYDNYFVLMGHAATHDFM